MVLITKDFLIVIADDDTDDQEFIQSALKRNNYNGICKCVDDGQTLVEYLKQLHYPTRPGLILLDLNMPFKNGYQALTEIKNEPGLKDIPVVVFTSSLRKEDEAKSYSLGCDKFMRKPMSLMEYDYVASSLMRFLEAR
ncbi:MAG: response regulator [Bacteroidota bacterium]